MDESWVHHDSSIMQLSSNGWSYCIMNYHIQPNFIFFQELIEKLSKGELSKEDYPCLNDPTPTLHQSPQAHSIRSRRTPTWAQRGISGDGISRYISLLNLLVCAVHQCCLFFLTVITLFNGLDYIYSFVF